MVFSLNTRTLMTNHWICFTINRNWKKILLAIKDYHKLPQEHRFKGSTFLFSSDTIVSCFKMCCNCFYYSLVFASFLYYQDQMIEWQCGNSSSYNILRLRAFVLQAIHKSLLVQCGLSFYTFTAAPTVLLLPPLFSFKVANWIANSCHWQISLLPFAFAFHLLVPEVKAP